MGLGEEVYEGLDFLGVFVAGGEFGAGGDIDGAGGDLGDGVGCVIGVESAGEDDGGVGVFGDEVAGDGPVEGLSGAAVVLAGRGVDEEGEVFGGELVVREVLGGDGADDGDVGSEEVPDVVEGFVAVELDDIDDAFLEEVFGEGEGVVDEDADAEDLACEVDGKGLGVIGGAVAF